MANTSIYAAFEQFWRHVVAALRKKANLQHTHCVTDIYGGQGKFVLWENSYPHSAMESFDITDVTSAKEWYDQYDGIEILFTNVTNALESSGGHSYIMTTGTIPIVGTPDNYFTEDGFCIYSQMESIYYAPICNGSDMDETPYGICSRPFFMDSTGIHIGNGKYFNYTSGQVTDDNCSCVPVAVYAIINGIAAN